MFSAPKIPRPPRPILPPKAPLDPIVPAEKGQVTSQVGGVGDDPLRQQAQILANMRRKPEALRGKRFLLGG